MQLSVLYYVNEAKRFALILKTDGRIDERPLLFVQFTKTDHQFQARRMIETL